jgi:hypothetical protein
MTPEKAFWLTVLVISLVLLALISTVRAQTHDHEWTRRHTNAAGTSCCTGDEATRISHERANQARVGSEITATFPDVGSQTVKITAIHPTRDRTGQPWVTLYGCLFRWSGS